jgi:hypothetical protein
MAFIATAIIASEKKQQKSIKKIVDIESKN